MLKQCNEIEDSITEIQISSPKPKHIPHENRKRAYLEISEVIIVGIIKALHDAGLVAALVLSHAEPAIPQGAEACCEHGDDDDQEPVRIARRVLRFEHQRSYKVACDAVPQSKCCTRKTLDSTTEAKKVESNILT